MAQFSISWIIVLFFFSLTGCHVSAPEALKLGMVDQVTEQNTCEVALEFALKAVGMFCACEAELWILNERKGIRVFGRLSESGDAPDKSFVAANGINVSYPCQRDSEPFCAADPFFKKWKGANIIRILIAAPLSIEERFEQITFLIAVKFLWSIAYLLFSFMIRWYLYDLKLKKAC